MFFHCRFVPEFPIFACRVTLEVLRGLAAHPQIWAEMVVIGYREAELPRGARLDTRKVQSPRYILMVSRFAPFVVPLDSPNLSYWCAEVVTKEIITEKEARELFEMYVPMNTTPILARLLTLTWVVQILSRLLHLFTYF